MIKWSFLKLNDHFVSKCLNYQLHKSFTLVKFSIESHEDRLVDNKLQLFLIYCLLKAETSRIAITIRTVVSTINANNSIIAVEIIRCFANYIVRFNFLTDHTLKDLKFFFFCVNNVVWPVADGGKIENCLLLVIFHFPSETQMTCR